MKLNQIAGTIALAVFAFSPLTASYAQAPARAASTAPVLCAVKGEVISDVTKAAGKSAYKGKTYYFCCPGCVAAFDKADDTGKARFARLTELRTEKIVLAKKMETVNGELSTLEKATAKKATVKAEAPKAVAVATTVALHCAVTDEEIATVAEAAGGSSVYSNKTYYFCCAGCKPKFDSDPAKYSAIADKRDADRVKTTAK